MALTIRCISEQQIYDYSNVQVQIVIVESIAECLCQAKNDETINAAITLY